MLTKITERTFWKIVRQAKAELDVAMSQFVATGKILVETNKNIGGGYAVASKLEIISQTSLPQLQKLIVPETFKQIVGAGFKYLKASKGNLLDGNRFVKEIQNEKIGDVVVTIKLNMFICKSLIAPKNEFHGRSTNSPLPVKDLRNHEGNTNVKPVNHRTSMTTGTTQRNRC